MIGLSLPATIAFALAVTFVIAANFIVYAMLGQVNARLPPSERLSYVGFHFAKNRQINTLYRQFYPEGRLHWVSRISFGSAVVCMIMVVALDQ